ncbi:MAG: leukotriene A4 hydrolase C-terminal domain-containing protein [Gammaproteobacteria bacterium]|nr:leukotriene A4 hydrolase C-terminal domain-containing protein [Gammaproteobacteria bacterium]
MSPRRALAIAVLAFCVASPSRSAPAGSRTEHSYANLDAFRVTRVALDLDADFASHQLRGTAVLTVRRQDPSANHLVLDTHGLRIFEVAELTRATYGAPEAIAPFWVSRPFRLGVPDPIDGTALIIDVPRSDAAKETFRIEYETSPRAPGLNWTTARAGGRGPRILYALSQPFGARSWIPLQDSPRARVRVVLRLRTPSDMVALLSDAADPSAKHPFAPTSKRAAAHGLITRRALAPSQLDLVVGDLKFAAIDDRAGVYAPGWSAHGPARALREYPAVRAAGDRLLGVSAGARRDFVVMPAAFAFRTLAAPGLSLLSPTLFDRTRDPVPLAARLPFAAGQDDLEPATRADAWIGRAFAAYAQSRVAAELYGAPNAAVLDTLAYLEQRASLADSPPLDRACAGGAVGRAGDVGSSRLAREKGRLFFETLAASVGRSRFDAFARRWFAAAAGRPAGTARFEQSLVHRLIDPNRSAIRRVDLTEWLHAPGVPSAVALPDAATLRAVDAVRSGWLAGRIRTDALGARHWSEPQWRYFLEGLPAPVGAARLARLDAAYRPMRVLPPHAQSAWLQVAIENRYPRGIEAASAYLEAGGRLDLLAPIYAALVASPDGAALAHRVYSRARAGYDPLAAARIGAIVGRDPAERTK